ncbi:hypothetical protein NOR53_1792 [gamma proteobacterium NOR5-3]|jgi:hypothetical protein|nr:hypothetical protein NOR53_1792 [gamma proteobacterium NOR5-3]
MSEAEPLSLTVAVGSQADTSTAANSKKGFLFMDETVLLKE